ncbi:ankyrin repeat domain-containing protein SOWAHC [Lampris incognitus]|uniref:ankyrin repeat domain-containing protein SOWAHC n=1 Tax=Lampris incognitus TaxID=2546036 RepID=UPI0024B4AA28|nr:ankyrin repeat domain-containing protein SOWAHC [Lampris incognitus]
MPTKTYNFLNQESSPQGADEADHRHPLQQTLFNPEQDLTSDTACKDEAEESGGSIPSLVITQAEESQRPAFAQPVALPVSPTEKTEVQIPERPTDLEIPAVACTPTDPSPSSSDGGDMTCCDLLSLKSDSISLASEAAISRRSLFHRVQMDPLEKAWLRSSALGNISAQHQLLAQDPSLALKKTALHWAAKQGRLEAVDMMLSSGVDVNVRSGYTALHLASIQGHLHVVQALLNTYHAKTNIRDYHGKTAVHYWNGSMDVFNKCGSQSGERLSRGRLTQRYTLPSLLLSRSRSQGQLNLDFGTMSHSPHHDVFNLQI